MGDLPLHYLKIWHGQASWSTVFHFKQLRPPSSYFFGVGCCVPPPPPLSRTENKGQQNILVCFLDHLNYSIKKLEVKQAINVKKHQQEILILLLGLADEQS